MLMQESAINPITSFPRKRESSASDSEHMSPKIPVLIRCFWILMPRVRAALDSRFRGNDVSGQKSGFTLVEMSVVLIVIGLLVLTVFPALTALRANSQRTVTQSNLQSLMLATAAYVQANGCLPCPTPAATLGAGFGRVGGSTGTAACVACTVATAEGIPPYMSLGLQPTVAHDGWGRWITMRVDPALTAVALGTIVPPTSVCTAADQAANPACTINTNRKGLCQPNLSSAKSAGAVQITTPGGATQQAAVIFVSHGSTGYGAFQAAARGADAAFSNGCRYNFPGVAAACLQSLSCNTPAVGIAYAECNANGQNRFVDAMTMDGYDDMMAFADRNALISMLNNGACN
jgi:prepilin-type N-terminal cleavage/methylation domain-containing protein